MALFGGSTKKGYIGVDIGAGSIKLVELVLEKGQQRVMTYGYTEQPNKAKSDKPLIEEQKKAAELITKVCKKSGVESVKVVSALPLSKVFSAVIRVPRVKDEKDLKPLIEAQARKLVPLPLEEMILDSKMVDDIKKPAAKSKKLNDKSKKTPDPKKPLIGERKEQEYVRVLITGAAKSLVQKYVQIFKSAKLELVALETESFALIRSLVGKDKSRILIIDLGATRSNLTVVEKGVPFLTRSVNVGGDMITKRIAEQMGVDFEEAEQIKQDLGGETGDSIPIIEDTLKPILNEIQYTFEQYAKQESSEGKSVEKIILTGGSAHLPGLSNLIASNTNINTYVGDPWARTVYPNDLRPILDEIGPRMSVAIGLAMRDSS